MKLGRTDAVIEYQSDAALAGFLVVTHHGQVVIGRELRGLHRQTKATQQPGETGNIVLAAKAEPHGSAGRQHHADGHGLAMADDPVSRQRFNGMAESVPVIQNCP